MKDSLYASRGNSRSSRRHFSKRKESMEAQQRATELIALVEVGPAKQEKGIYDSLDFPFTPGWPKALMETLRIDPSNEDKPIWGTAFYYESDELLHACPISEQNFSILGSSGMDNPHQVILKLYFDSSC